MHQKTRIKICGIRDIDTALLCTDLGVDFIGFNFSPVSKRKVDVRLAETILNSIYQKKQSYIPKIVFLIYKNTMEFIDSLFQKLTPDMIQFVTEDSLEVLMNLQEWNLPFIPQFPIKPDFKLEDLYRYNTEFMILDAYKKGMGGGTGEIFNWDLIKGVERKYILAGGLNSENVKEAIIKLKPYGVDVASGVESSPGIKDPKKIQEFVKNVRKV